MIYLLSPTSNWECCGQWPSPGLAADVINGKVDRVLSGVYSVFRGVYRVLRDV